jgi:hypothetical protein
MLFQEGASAVVRLSDALKLALDTLAGMTNEALLWSEPHRDAVREHKRRAERGDLEGALECIPVQIAQEGVFRQSRIHSQSLTTILLSCFLLESYINTLAHFLLEEQDLLGLIRDGRKSSAEVLFEAIERMKVREKWSAVARLAQGRTFDASKKPWQDFDILFKFRDDHVHDKVQTYAKLGKKRYAGKFPDNLSGLLTLRHALFAADTYWAMVDRVHGLLGIPMGEFHRHYNLSPWPEDPSILRSLSNRHEEAF